MAVLIIVLLVTICVLLWHGAVGYPRFLSAGAGDWLLVFRPNEQDSTVDCWFEPVVAYMLHKNETTPIPSSFDKTIKVLNDRSKELWTDAYWVRDGLLFDMHGSNCGSLSETLEGWHSNFEKVSFNSAVPGRYLQLVSTARGQRS